MSGEFIQSGVCHAVPTENSGDVGGVGGSAGTEPTDITRLPGLKTCLLIVYKT